MTIIIFLIVLSVLVFVHELGHLLAAKSFGIRVDEFGIGLPPRAAKLFNWRGTLFTLNWLPIGGFVKIFGESGEEGPGSFISKNRGKQALVLVSGVMANMIFAWLLLSLAIALRSGIGGGVLLRGMEATWQITSATFSALGSLHLADVSGPLGLVGLVGEASQAGFITLLVFTAIISINLAIVNLLPIPALDGGRLLFVLIESIRRRPISPMISNALNNLGFLLLILLLILVTIGDIGRIW